jgi:UDP-2,3-diacylglucosamine pyrophosphatase LpxH
VLLIGYSFTGNFWVLIDNKSIKEKNGNSMSQNLSIKVSNPVVIPMSNNRDNPVCIDPTDTVTINLGSETTNIKSVNLYKLVDGEVDEAVPDCSCVVDENDWTITITPKLEEGEEYKVEVSYDDTNKASLIGYFAVNYSFDLENGIVALKGRKLVVCISDIHLGMDDAYAECKENRPHLENFLTKIQSNHNVEELVIAGDFIDEWFIPATVDTFAGKTQKEFVQKVVDNNSAIFTAINAIIQSNKIAVTYVPGNHDLLITSDEINKVLPKVNQIKETQGLGSYSPKSFPQAIIEHGHRYNFFCAPDPLSNSKIAENSILPPGYFFTRIAVESIIQGKKNEVQTHHIDLTYGNESQYLCSLYAQLWESLLKGFPLSQKLNDEFIVTNIDGFKKSYSIQDILPCRKENGELDMNLYSGIQDTWKCRQIMNNVNVLIPTSDAINKANDNGFTDEMSYMQYFSNPNSDKRIIVFGHTHVAKITTYLTHDDNKRAIYANSGTWIDNNHADPTRTMTFVVLIPRKNSTSIPAFVNLYQYLPNGTIIKLAAQAITGLSLVE